MEKWGKSIRLFLMDGNADGRWMCELSNWTGKAYKIPRAMLKDCENRSDLNASGVYFLFGTDDETGKPFVYIGESEDIYKRLSQNLGQPFYWIEAIVFVSKDEHLNKAHIKYLERRFYDIAVDIARYSVKNGNIPKKSAVSEAEEAELEEFLSKVVLMMGILGHPVFESVLSQESNEKDDILYFSRKGGKGGEARGKITNEGFVVLKGSYIYPEYVEYSPESIRKLREQHADLINGEGILQKDLLFTSPSYAAVFVCGKNSNGLVEWKNAQNVTLKELEEKKAEYNAPV